MGDCNKENWSDARVGIYHLIYCFLCCVHFRLFKPRTFADCLGDELPYGWDIACDPQVGTYYINHQTS